MNSEQDPFEQELRKLAPSKLPGEFSERLSHAWKFRNPPSLPPQTVRAGSLRRNWLRWLAPAVIGATAAFVLIFQIRRESIHGQSDPKPSTTPAAMNADDVQIDRRLLSSFNAETTLPGGEPVRILCREWMDQVELRDSSRGLEIQQRIPRLEIVSVEPQTF